MQTGANERESEERGLAMEAEGPTNTKGVTPSGPPTTGIATWDWANDNFPVWHGACQTSEVLETSEVWSYFCAAHPT